MSVLSSLHTCENVLIRDQRWSTKELFGRHVVQCHEPRPCTFLRCLTTEDQLTRVLHYATFLTRNDNSETGKLQQSPKHLKLFFRSLRMSSVNSRTVSLRRWSLNERQMTWKQYEKKTGNFLDGLYEYEYYSSSNVVLVHEEWRLKLVLLVNTQRCDLKTTQNSTEWFFEISSSQDHMSK